MKRIKKPGLLLLFPATAVFFIVLAAFNRHAGNYNTTRHAIACKPEVEEKGCVFRTLTGLEPFDTASVFADRKRINQSLQSGLSWLMEAQQASGGWGAGSHQRQDVRDPHAVPADPASTALVAMALLRTGGHPYQGKYADPLKKATQYLIHATESSAENAPNITRLTQTQPQTKLGKNIDVILTAQFFSNALHHLQEKDAALKQRIEKALQKCVRKIEKGQDHDGGWKEGGWAPVLQSALANNALEGAQDIGAAVNDEVLQRSREYQKGNYDVKTKSAVTGKAAGVMLYSISSSARASAKEARQAQEKIKEAKKSGKLQRDARVSEENLVKAGYTRPEAQKLMTAYEVQVNAAARAQEEDVMAGFGSNGGEEFLSYLMTGESLIIGSDNAWQKWYEKMSGRLIQIQNADGSWNGHHCITSPVFCTATCLLILSIDKEIDYLAKTKTNNR